MLFCDTILYIVLVLVYETKILYHSLVKECPWVEHLASLPIKGVGTVLSAAFNP